MRAPSGGRADRRRSVDPPARPFASASWFSSTTPCNNQRGFLHTRRSRHRDRTGWLTMQSTANLSPLANSLLTGKLTGIFAFSGPILRFERPIEQQLQCLAAKFPTQRNRELFSRNRELFETNREFSRAEQGTQLPRGSGAS